MTPGASEMLLASEMIKDDGIEITEGSLPIKLESETQED
jgi:hypothetical protein